MKRICQLALFALVALVSAIGQTVATPTFSASGGSVTISTSTPGAGIWYTTDGSTPTLPAGGVPSGTSSSYTPMCQAVVQPPLSSLKNITAYGAVTGGTDNTTAISNACAAAGNAQSGGPSAQISGIYIPAGTFYYGNSSNAPTLNCNIYGQGPTSELYCPSPIVGGGNCTMYTTGSNEVWSKFSHVVNSTTRDATNPNIYFNGGSNNRTDTLMVVGGDAGGIFQVGTNSIDTNNGIFNTKADSNYHPNGSNNNITDHTYVYNSGDDSDSNVQYVGSGTVSNNLIQWNNLSNNAFARGASVGGGSNMTFQDNLFNTLTGVGMYISQEANDVDTDGPVNNIIARYNYIENGDTSGTQDCLIVYDQYASGSVTNVLVQGNYITGCNSPNIAVFNGGGPVSDVSVINNTVTGTTAMWNNSGTVTNLLCTGNTYNGASNNSGTNCSTTASGATATGSSLTYSGCVVGTAQQYTGAISVPGGTTIKAVAVFPGLTNSSIGSYTSGPTAATPTFSPVSGTTFSGTQAVTISDSTPSSTISYYTSSPAISIITTVGPTFTDSSGNVWSIVGTIGASNGHMAINGQTLTATSYVTQIVYVNGNVWQENIANNWYEVTSVTGTPPSQTVTFGSATTTSPIPAYSTYTSPIMLSASSSITAYASASGYSNSAVANGTYTKVVPTCPISSGSSESTVASIIGSCPSGSTATFAAGSYALGASTITIPCGVSLSGPTISPSYTSWGTLTYNAQTAILTSSSRANSFFSINSGCTTAMTISYLEFSGVGALIINTPSSNVTLEYNSFVNIPCHSSSGCFEGNADQAVWVNGGASNSNLNNFIANWNQFGDPNSCLTPSNVMTSTTDVGGLCAGILTNSFINGLTLQNNSFYHLEEGFHILCYGDTCNGTSGVTPPIPTVANVNISNNDFQANHRIPVEIQPQGASNLTINDNSIWNCFSCNTFSFGLSLACCDGNAPYGLLPGSVPCYPGGPSCSSTTPATPNVPIVTNNVLVQNNTPAGAYGWGYTIEWWGWGAQAIQNLIQGLSVNGIAWGAGSSPWAANYNAGCGSMGQTVVPEGYAHIVAPSQTGNTFSSTCSAVTTTAPTISPASGGQTFPLTVTLTDAGNTSATTPVPQGNVTIWYTTDGSTPAPNSGTSKTCTTVGSTSCAFVLSSPGTVKAVGMWGQGANTLSYPSNYAFTPSAAATATYTGGPPTLTSCSQTNSGSVSTVGIGQYVQQIAQCYYASVPTTTNCSTADAYGNAVTAWGSSAPSTMSMGAVGAGSGCSGSLQGAGCVKGLVAGTASATATVTGGVSCTSYPFTVTQPTTATPVISPPSQSFTGSLSISMTDSTSGASIYYTTNGVTPVAGPGGATIGTQYYLSPTGNDSNSGTSSGSPWLTPNHAVNCGDVINAAAGTYASSNFQNFGTVTCALGNNVAWLKCATFDGCKISATSQDGIWVNKSYWGVQGWEVTTSSDVYAACFRANSTSGTIHHIVFANDIANGCMGGGFNAYDISTSASVDYISYIGNIAYNTAQGNGECFSGFNIYQPIASDTAAGTHIYVAGNFAWNNVDPNPCGGTAPTDGEGIIMDTFDFSQGGGTPYTQQAAVENNILVGNGGRGIEFGNNNTSSHATFISKNNTAYGNNTQSGQAFPSGLGEIYINEAYQVASTADLAMTSAGTVGGNAIYAFGVTGSNGTSSVSGDWLYSAAGNNTNSSSSPGFSFGTNTLSNPVFSSTAIPGAPSCSSATSVANCMASLVTNFRPTAAGSSAYGYQTPSVNPVTDAYFPLWLCNVGLPSGLVSMPCSPIYTAPFTITITTNVQAIAAFPGYINSGIASNTYTLGAVNPNGLIQGPTHLQGAVVTQ